MIVINAKIMTMNENDEIIERGFLRTDGRFIAEAGDMLDYEAVQSDAETVVDACGATLYPGFIDAHTHLGMCEDGLHVEGDDLNEITDPATPHLRAIDAVNPLDRAFEEALEAGITSVATGPGSANPIGGQFIAMKTAGKRIDDMIIKSPLAMKMAFGENPKICYGNKNQMPETRMATAAVIRDNLKKAQKYLEAMEKAANPTEDDEYDEPDFDIKCEALLPLLKGEMEAHIHAHRADDIFTAVRIAKEFNIKYTIVHCTEGYLIADELKKDGVKAIVGPIICDRSKPELKNLSIKNAAELYDAGVPFALTTDHPVAPVQYLPYAAALAVKAGLGEYEAIAAMTKNPAAILGLSDRIGSLAPGKDADFVIFDGSPLDILSDVRMVAVDGVVRKNNL